MYRIFAERDVIYEKQLILTKRLIYDIILIV